MTGIWSSHIVAILGRARGFARSESSRDTEAFVQPELVIWGASSHAMVVADIVRCEGRYGLAGFLDDVDPSRAGTMFAGGRVLGGAEQLPRLAENGVTHAIIGFGEAAPGSGARERAAERVEAAGLQLATAVHPSAVLASDVELGPGTVVHSGVVVEPGVRVGVNAILNCVSGVGHECVIGDGVHLGGRASLAGLVTIGAGTMLELGVMVTRGVQIGAGSHVGSMSLVLRDIPDGVLAYGSPAKVVRRIAPQ